MSEPIVFTSRHKIKQEKLDEFKPVFVDGLAAIEDDKPSTIFQYAYVNSNWTEVSFVHIFPNADAFEHHLIGVDDRAKKGYEFIEPMSMEKYGSPGEKILQMFKQIEAGGVSFTLWPETLGDFTRLSEA